MQPSWRLALNSAPSRIAAMAAALLWALLPCFVAVAQAEEGPSWIEVPYCSASPAAPGGTASKQPSHRSVVLHFASSSTLLWTDTLAGCLPTPAAVTAFEAQRGHAWGFTPDSNRPHDRSLSLPAVRGPPSRISV